MTNLQHLLTDLETKQQELTTKLDKAIELKAIILAKHQQNLVKIQKQIDHDVIETTLDKSLIQEDNIDYDISKLKLELSDIENTLKEIFKL